MRLGLALSEKQTPQVVEKIEKPKEQIEGLESSVVLRRQTLYPPELRARWLILKDFAPSRPSICNLSYHVE